jgi:putative hydrolase of the HAD superfamily
MKIRAIIFDLDNTLIDFMKFKKACINASVDAMISEGLSVSKSEAISIVFELYKEYGWDNQKIFDKFLKKTKGLVDYKLLATAITAYRREKTKYMKPYPNVVPTLKKLKSKGIKLAILSDAPRLQAYIRLADLGLLDYFDPIVTLDDTGKRKPHPAPFKKILSELKLKPQEVLMVGDAPQWDIKGAKAVGMKTCLARYGLMPHTDAKKIRADYEINDIKELAKIVQ